MIRDGRDVVASLKARRRPENAHAAVKAAAARWARETTEAIKWSEWDAQKALHRPGGNRHILLLRYEALVANRSTTLKQIFNFLEEDFDETQILSYSKKRVRFNAIDSIYAPTIERGISHDRLRAYQFNLPLFDGRGRWRQMPPRGLSEEDHRLVAADADFQALLRKLGYV